MRRQSLAVFCKKYPQLDVFAAVAFNYLTDISKTNNFAVCKLKN
jgi:hypothetical protein